MTRYVGRVGLSGSLIAHVTIEDIDAPTWKAEVRKIGGFDVQPGLVSVEILDGERAGLYAIGELLYREGAQVFPYREGPCDVFGRTPFGPAPSRVR